MRLRDQATVPRFPGSSARTGPTERPPSIFRVKRSAPADCWRGGRGRRLFFARDSFMQKRNFVDEGRG